jgi:hypothetical protein
MSIHLNNPYRPGNPPEDIDGIIDSTVSSKHFYYGFLPRTVDGWDPTGALRNQRKHLVRVTCFAQMIGCRLGVMVENQQAVPNTIYVGQHLPYITTDVLYEQRFFRTPDLVNPELGRVTVNLGSETFALAAFDGTIDFAGPSGAQKAYGPNGHGSYVVAFDTTDAGLLSFFDTHPVTIYSVFVETGGGNIQSDWPVSTTPPQMDTLIEDIQQEQSHMFLRYWYT